MLTFARVTDHLPDPQAVELVWATVGDGRVAVIAPPERIADLTPVVGAGGTDLEQPVVLLTVRQAKGLEFDAVVVVDPAGIAAESARGASDLYVALTRPTQRLTVLGDLPL